MTTNKYMNNSRCYVYDSAVCSVVCPFLVFCSACMDDGCGVSHVVSNECDEPTPTLVQPIGVHGGEVMYFRSFCLG